MKCSKPPASAGGGRRILRALTRAARFALPSAVEMLLNLACLPAAQAAGNGQRPRQPPGGDPAPDRAFAYAVNRNQILQGERRLEGRRERRRHGRSSGAAAAGMAPRERHGEHSYAHCIVYKYTLSSSVTPCRCAACRQRSPAVETRRPGRRAHVPAMRPRVLASPRCHRHR